MKIVIAGGGSIGYHLAKLLSLENQDITVIENDQAVIENISIKLDVMSVLGDATSIATLTEANVKNADLYITVTTSEGTNLLSAILAHQLGAKHTIARVNNPEFLSEDQKTYFKTIGIDKIISPQQLAANEILRLVKRSSLTDILNFEDGEISIAGFTVDDDSILIDKTVSQLGDELNGIEHRAVALLRNHNTQIPKSHTKLQKGDHVYLSIKTKHLDLLSPFLGKESKPIKNIMIIGDSDLSLKTAELLQDNYQVILVIQDENLGNYFLKHLSKTLVIIGDPNNKELLEQEGIDNMDAFIALSQNSEINILTSLLAEEFGVYKTIAYVDNEVYTHISQSIGIDTIINKKLIAANYIFRFVRKGNIKVIATLHGVAAEVIEYQITKSNRITSHTLGELHLPDSCVVAGVVRDNQSIIPNDDFLLQKLDKVIILAMPNAINKIEAIFR